MKKLVLSLLCGAMVFSAAACSSAEPAETPFDENNIVLSFGALADIHITGDEQESEWFRSALAQLQSRAALNDADGLDAVCIAGDLANEGKREQAELFAQIVNEAGIKNVLLTVGNHDVYNGGVSEVPLSVYRELLGEEYFKADTDMSLIAKGARHCEVNGYHFFFVEPKTFNNPRPYDEEVVKWLDDSIGTIVKKNPNAYVFVFTHLPIADTVWGSSFEDGDYTTGLKDTLEKYPQVIAFTGHMHRNIMDERTIMQTGFTSVLCGSIRNQVFEAGYSNVLKGSWTASIPADGHEASMGHLVQVDKNGNIRITRMAFGHESTYKEPWELSAPTESGRNLTKYTAARKDANTAPTLEGTVTAEFSAEDPLTATVTIPAGKDDDFVLSYLVKVRNADGKLVSHDKYLSDFYLVSNPSEMKPTFSWTITVPEAGEYTVSVVAYDSWNAKSKELTGTITFG